MRGRESTREGERVREIESTEEGEREILHKGGRDTSSCSLIIFLVKSVEFQFD